MTKTVMILPGCTDTHAKEMFRSRGWNAFIHVGGMATLDQMPDVDAICFMGGVDVDPAIYGEPMGQTTQHPNKARDAFEVAVYNKFLGKAMMFGICRGAQLLNVLNGGRMIQECGYRGGIQTMKLPDGVQVYHEVCHHQGIVCTDQATRIGFDSEGKLDYLFHYPDTMSGGIQGHPEWGNEDTEDSFFLLIKQMMLVRVRKEHEKASSLCAA